MLRKRLHKACGCWIKGESRQQCDRFTIDEFGDHIHSCTQHAGATTSSHEHILTAVQRLFNQAGFATERKNVPHSRGMKKADLHVKDFRLE